jgi:hypothetical protein
MSMWEIYCALYGSTSSPCKISTLSPENLEQRREKVRKQKPAVEAGEQYCWDMDEASDYLDDDGSADTIAHNMDAVTGYDPSLVTTGSSSWVCEMRCLGLNRAASESRRLVSSFSSGSSLLWPGDGRMAAKLMTTQGMDLSAWRDVCRASFALS